MKKHSFAYLFLFAVFFSLNQAAHGAPTTPDISDPGTSDTTLGNYLVDWSNSTDPAGIDCYEFQEASNPDFANATVWYPPANQSHYQFYNHGNGTFYYRVRAKNTAGAWGEWSTQGADMLVNRDLTPPSAPSLADPGVNNYTGNFLVNWSDAADDSGIEVYEFQESATLDFSNPVTLYPPASQSEYQYYNHANGTYYYRVRAKDLAGNWSNWSLGTTDLMVLLDTTDPSVPVLASPSNPLIESQYSVDWSDSADNSGIETYDLQEDTNPNFTSLPEFHVYPTTSQFDLTNKAEGTYYYRVRAKDNAGHWSAWSNTVNFTVQFPVVSNVQISNITDSSANVSWTTDIAVPTKIERYGMIKNHTASFSNNWNDSNYRFQGINYAPAEEHCLFGNTCAEADIEKALQTFKQNNINLINLYNIGWPEIAHLEEYIFSRCQELGIKINFRLEAYDKTTFHWDDNDAQWIINHYASSIQYALQYPQAVAYYMLNMPFDDFELRDIYYGGYPSSEQQRVYVASVKNRLRQIDSNLDHKFFVNVGYGGGDLDPHGFITDLVDGISVHVYSTTYFPFPYCYDYPPNENDPEYLNLNKDVFDYFLDKNYAEHRIAEYGIPMIIDQTGYCDITDFGAGKVATRASKQRAIELLTNYLQNDPRVQRGWSYFKAFDKFGVGGENASWGMIDTLTNEDEAITTTHSVTLTELFHSVNYEVILVAGGEKSGGHYFQTLDPAPDQNVRPRITITNPAYGNETATNGSFTIRWKDSDPDDNATISLYYDLYDKAPLQGADNRPEPSKYQGTLIVSGLSENDAANSYTWNVSNITPGSYMIYAVIEDSFPGHDPEIDYSSGRVITTQQQMKAYYSPSASQISVNGIPDETIWNATEWVSLQTSTNPDQSTAKVKMLYDDDYLYIAFEVQDTKVETSLPQTPWDHDGLSVTLFNGTVDNFTPLGKIVKARLTADGVFKSPKVKNRPDFHQGALYLGTSTLNNNSDSDSGYTGEIKLFMPDMRIVANSGDIIPLDILFMDHDNNPGAVYSQADFSKTAFDGQANDDLAGASLKLDDRLVAHQATSPMVMDGILSEGDWTAATSWVRLMHPSVNDSSQAKIKAVWDSQALYISFDVSDQHVETSDMDWDDDTVTCTLFANGVLSKNRQDAGGSGEGPSIKALYLKPGTTLDNDNDQDTGYTVEMKIEWNSTGVTPSPGILIPADFLFVDHDQNPGQSYGASGTVFSKKSWDKDNNPDTAGKFILLGN
jgi:hypothetical protein